MVNLTSGNGSNRQLVSYILVAYNQENMIREAVESAFEQTYEPLEIVLSDDCSTDKTFEIILAMANAYSGPHRIRTMRNERNLGVVEHILLAGRRAAGEITVWAAGDDVSVPDRTDRLVAAFDENTGGVFSLVSIIDESGNVMAPLSERQFKNEIEESQLFLREKPADEVALRLIGCSSAFAKWVLELPIELTLKERGEDTLLSLHVILTGAQIRRIDLPLVKYRYHSGSITHGPKQQASPEDREQASFRYHESMVRQLDDFENLAIALGKAELMDLVTLERERMVSRDIAEWPSLSFSRRVKRIVRLIFSDEPRRIKWKLARLWGSHPMEYQPHLYFSRLRNTFSKARD